jgi:asparagine synthase (glutamine-hydrolysing)
LHVAALRRILDFLDRPGRWYDRDTVAPLLSQPVVELCLAVPGWVWTEGGHDRAPARVAFAGHLPPEVTWRRGKGRIESACAAAYLASRARLKVLLLEGQLARAGLLERGAVEACLARDTLDGTFDYFRLIELADVEAWLASIAAARL